MNATNGVFKKYLDEAVRFHGHLCGGQVMGVKMAMAGLRELGIKDPRSKEGRDLVIFVEIDRCAADAIISVTGRTPGKRSIKIVDYGKMAATFVETGTGMAVRVSARADSDRTVQRMARAHMPEKDEKAAAIQALMAISEEDLLDIRRVAVRMRPEDLPGEPLGAVVCEACGETVKDMREVRRDGKILCRPCAEGVAYYSLPAH